MLILYLAFNLPGAPPGYDEQYSSLTLNPVQVPEVSAALTALDCKNLLVVSGDSTTPWISRTESSRVSSDKSLAVAETLIKKGALLAGKYLATAWAYDPSYNNTKERPPIGHDRVLVVGNETRGNLIMSFVMNKTEKTVPQSRLFTGKEDPSKLRYLKKPFLLASVASIDGTS